MCCSHKAAMVRKLTFWCSGRENKLNIVNFHNLLAMKCFLKMLSFNLVRFVERMD